MGKRKKHIRRSWQAVRRAYFRVK